MNSNVGQLPFHLQVENIHINLMHGMDSAGSVWFTNFRIAATIVSGIYSVTFLDSGTYTVIVSHQYRLERIPIALLRVC